MLQESFYDVIDDTIANDFFFLQNIEKDNKQMLKAEEEHIRTYFHNISNDNFINAKLEWFIKENFNIFMYITYKDLIKIFDTYKVDNVEILYVDKNNKKIIKDTLKKIDIINYIKEDNEECLWCYLK